MNLSLTKPIAFFDIESTGLDTVKDRIVEIAILKIYPDGKEYTLSKKINPTIPIPLKTSKIHHIYDKDIKNEPTFKEAAWEIHDFFKGADLSGFNLLRFDIPILVEEFLRVDINFELKGRNIIDVQRIFHLMEPRNLAGAYRFYCNKNLTNAHTAQADTKATFEVLMSQIERYKETPNPQNPEAKKFPIQNNMAALSKLTKSKNVDLSGRMVFDEKNQVVFNFGKHKGRPVVDILKKEKGYYNWIMNNDFSLDFKNKLTQIQLDIIHPPKKERTLDF